MKEAVEDVIWYNDRLTMVTFVIQEKLFIVISGYAPQTDCTQEKDLFIADVEALTRTVKVDKHKAI
jgi:hypothetical protein